MMPKAPRVPKLAGALRPVLTQHQRWQIGAHLCVALLVLGCLGSTLQWGPRLLALRQQPRPLAPSGPGVDALAGDAMRVYGTAPARPVAPPEGFRLWGVIGGGERAGAALIGVGSARAQAFPVGAEVAPGVRLVDTAFGRAVLLRDGTRETLATQPGPAGAMPGSATPDRFEIDEAESAAAWTAHQHELASRTPER